MIFLIIALIATIFALLAGLLNFWRAGASTKSTFWMRTRIICQGLALLFFAITFYKGL